jgi:DNA invertase Pin-like site-specific DNA recombinase
MASGPCAEGTDAAGVWEEVMRAVAYARVSTEEQARSGLGLEAQRQVMLGEAARHGWTLEHVTDEGVSGSVRPEERPGLGTVLGSLSAGDALIVAKLDRLGRSALDVLRLAEAARDKGWRLVACDLGLDTGTPVGAFTLTALAAVAQLERDLIAQRTRDALAELKRQGVRLGRPVAIPEDIRQRVAELRTAGLSQRAVADQLNAEGVPTARGGRWHGGTVCHVMRSLALDAESKAATS